MPRKRHTAEQIIRKLRETEVELALGVWLLVATLRGGGEPARA